MDKQSIKTEEKEDGTIIQRMGDGQTLKAINCLAELQKYPNVIGYTTDMGKITKGKKTGEPALTILVKEKVDPTRLNIAQKIPQTINGEKTDVVEIGEVRSETLPPSEYQKYHEKPPMGVSWCNIKGTAGTAGFPVTLNGVLCRTSNTHVDCESVRKDLKDQCRDITQPGPKDGGTGVRGYVAKAIIMPHGMVAYNDFSIGRPVNDTELNPETLGFKVIPRGMTTLKVGDRVWKEGRTTGLTYGEVLSLSATISVGYAEGNITHVACILMTNMSAGGDSGSGYYLKASEGDEIRDEDKYAVAYGFAGSFTITVCHEIQNAISATGVQLYTQQQEPPTPEDEIEVNFTLEKDTHKNYRIYGVVKGTNGDPLVSSKITLGEKVTMTGESGQYEFLNVQEGVYNITAEKEGYLTETKEVIVGSPTQKLGFWDWVKQNRG